MDPLQDTAAERTVLGAMLINPDLVTSAAGIVQPQHCSSQAHRTLFTTMLSMVEAGRSLDLVTLREELMSGGQLEAVGGVSYLAGLVDGIPRMTSADGYARIVREKARRRAAIAIAEKFLTAARSGDSGTDQLVDALQAGLSRLVESGERRTVKLSDVLPDAIKELERFAEARDAVTGIPSGLVDLDRTLGGWRNGALYVIAARTGRGKSAFCAQVATHAASVGVKTLVFSMEMAPYQLAGRMLLGYAEVDRWDVRRENAAADYAWAKVNKAFGKLAELPVWFDPRESPSLAEIRASVKQQASGPGVGLVIVDYLQRCTVDPKPDRWLAVGDLAKGLKSLARSMNIPVIAACQLNAEAEEKRPTLAMLGQAQSIIGAEADVVALMHPADLAKWKSQPFPQVDLLIDKNRHGPSEVVELSFEKACSRFVSIAKNGRG